MFKAYMTFALMALVLLGVTTTNVEAKTKKKKSRSKSSYVLEDTKNVKKKKKLKNKKNKKNKKGQVARYRRYKRSGTGPDLRALTTEQPNAEYIQAPDNGVNPLEMKAEL